MLRKVISGGQTGADMASLTAALVSGFPTGGWAPKGWMTKLGPNRLLLRDHYKLIECPEDGYPARTVANAKHSHATLLLVLDKDSPGTKCTIKACRTHGRPYAIIDLANPADPQDVAGWIEDGGFEVLNCAGNSHDTSPHMSHLVNTYLGVVFSLLKNSKVAPQTLINRFFFAPSLDPHNKTKRRMLTEGYEYGTFEHYDSSGNKVEVVGPPTIATLRRSPR